MKPLDQRKLYADHIRKEIEKSGILIEKCGTNQPTENQLFENFDPVGYSFHSIAVFLREKDTIPYQRNLNEIAKLFRVEPSNIYKFLTKPPLAALSGTAGKQPLSNSENIFLELEDIHVSQGKAEEDFARQTRETMDSLSRLCDQISVSLQEIFRKEIHRDKYRFLEDTFLLITEAPTVTNSLKIRIDTFLNDTAHSSWAERSVLASALTVSVLRNFDEQKMDYIRYLILDSCSDENCDVWQKACVGYYMGYARHLKKQNIDFKITISDENRDKINTLIACLKLISEDKKTLDSMICLTIPNSLSLPDYLKFYPFQNDETYQLSLTSQKNPEKRDLLKQTDRSYYLNSYGKFVLAMAGENDQIFTVFEKRLPSVQKELEFYKDTPRGRDINKMLLAWKELFSYGSYIYVSD